MLACQGEELRGRAEDKNYDDGALSTPHTHTHSKKNAPLTNCHHLKIYAAALIHSCNVWEKCANQVREDALVRLHALS